MSVSADDLQRALDWAKQNKDQDAVDAVTAEMERRKNREGALPAVAEPEPQGALQKTDYRDPEQYAAAGERQLARERALAQKQYNADLEWSADPASRPSADQINEFFNDPKNSKNAYGLMNQMGQQLVVDKDTGKLRYTALSPEQMDHWDKKGSTTRATVGALAYGGTRFGAAALAGDEAEIESLNSFQEYVLNSALPKEERDRVQKELIERFGKDSDFVKFPGTAPSDVVKEILDQNPENEARLEAIAGDEYGKERGEFFRRLGNRVSALIPYMPVNVFGADDPIGALGGRGSFEGIEYEEGERAPAYPGASLDLRKWKTEANRGTGVYEHFVMPLSRAISEDSKTPAEIGVEFSEGMIEKFYDEEQLAERELPIFSNDVEVNSIGDIFNSELYTDPNTKLLNPESLYLMFMENAPELAASYAVTRGSGSMGARAAGRNAYGQTVERMNKAREAAAGRSGMIAGGGTEGLLVQQHLENETRNILETIPMEVWREDRLFQEYTDAGLTEEAAKQIIAQDAASKAGVTGAVVTIATGAPMNRFMGQSAAGRLVNANKAARRTTGALGEPIQEGAQEVMEMLQTEAAVRPIDPNNPIFADPNRYLEAFGGGALISVPFGVAGSLEPAEPAGVNKQDVAAARATAGYMQATNERFRFETKISDPDHIANTTPNQRLKELEKLETLQRKEANTLLKAEPKMRQYLEKQGTMTAKTELKMLGLLKARANALKTDIAVAQSKRTTAYELQQAEREIMKDRAELQRKVNERVVKLEDLQSQVAAIESIQNQGDVTTEQEQDLIRDGYAKRTNDGKLVLKPKGRRAMGELNRQIRQLSGRLEAGYTGPERRTSENVVMRERLDQAGPAERESMLYEDGLTGAQNRRAFNERQEQIDVKEGQTPTLIENSMPVVAAVDVDSLKWVNDNMTHGAGDRLLVAVSDALAKQEGVEVYRLGGDEFAVTGSTDEQLEAALQAAAAELNETEIASGQDAVTPQITWGKGPTYAEADKESLAMKQDREARGIRAGRDRQAATYRDRKQQGLFQLDSDPMLLRSWNKARDFAERGDHVEVLTPDGAVHGVVTNVTNKRGRPRMKVNIQGRTFKFNPEMNWLIVDQMTSPADLAWITGDAEYARPGRESFPQTLSDIQIGHMSKDGVYYADLAMEYDYEADIPAPWWTEAYPEFNFDNRVPFVPAMRQASEAEIAAAEEIAAELEATNNNLPPINIVKSISQLRVDAPQVVEQMRAELNGGSLNGVRGYMDHVNPSNGVFIFPAHIAGQADSELFKQGVVETMMHEVIGHYGVRGFFGDEIDLREFMHEIVDAFPQLSSHYAVKLGLTKNSPSQKQLIGEEMVAYLAGQVASGEIDLTPKQKTVWQRFLAWVRDFMHRRGWNKWAPIKKFNAFANAKAGTSLYDTKVDFWNDERIQNLLARSQDFIRNGKGFEWRAINENSMLYMRDGDIFQAGLITAINSGMRKVTGAEKKQLAQKYGGKENVPNELPLFPETGSMNAMKEAVTRARKEGYLTEKELELSGLSEKSDFYLFRDGTYRTLSEVIQNSNPEHDPDWHKGVLPQHLSKELDEIANKMRVVYMVGPLRNLDTEVDRPSRSPDRDEAALERRKEIYDTKIDPKKTRISKDLLLKYMNSEQVFSVTVRQANNVGRDLTTAEAARRLFGEKVDDIDTFTDEMKKAIRLEQKAAMDRGYDIGYDKEQDRWFDYARGHTTSYAEYSPRGTRSNSDFRVALIKTQGRGGDMGTGQHDHYGKNLMHIRTGMAELLDSQVEKLEAEGMTWPNERVKGRMLALIELQSDWLQDLRKSFTTGDERDAAQMQVDRDQRALTYGGNAMGRKVHEDIFRAWDAMVVKPIEQLLDPTKPTENMKKEAVPTYGIPWENLDDSSKYSLWHTEKNAVLDKAVRRLRAAREELSDYKDKKLAQARYDIGGTMDARTFDALDKMAAGVLADNIMRTLGNQVDWIQYEMTSAASGEQLKAGLDSAQGNISKTLHKAGTLNNGDAALRFTKAKPQIEAMLKSLYTNLNIDTNGASDAVARLGTAERATIRIPAVTVGDLKTATQADWYPTDFVKEWLRPSFISAHTDIEPDTVSTVAVYTSDSEFIDIDVVGDKGSVDKFSKAIPDLINKWVELNAQQKLDEQRERVRRTMGRNQLTDYNEYNYSDMKSFLDLEVADVIQGDSYTRDNNITTLDEYEEQRFSDVFDENVRIAFNNITESEWDRLEREEDWEGVSREGETYLNLVERDEDDIIIDTAAAEQALDRAREQYEAEVLYERDDIRNETYTEIRNEWNESPAHYEEGRLPVDWDEHGNVLGTYVIQIIARDKDDNYDIVIDYDDVDYEYEVDDARESLAKAIWHYYADNDILPPAGTTFGPKIVEAEPEGEGPLNPNWDLVAGNIVNNLAVMSENAENLSQVFDRYVTNKKKSGSGVIKDSPLSNDKDWRPIALKYLISDAVRRGLGGIMWNNGLSSSARGGMGLTGATKTDSITWSKERMTLRGEEKDVYRISSSDMARDMVVDKERMIPVLGRDVLGIISMQESGKMESAPKVTPEVKSPMDNYIIGTTADHVQAVYRRADNEFLGFADSTEKVSELIQNDLRRESGARYVPSRPRENEDVAQVMAEGVVNSDMVGGKIHIIQGASIREYEHTFATPRLAGARQSYEDISIRIWNKELKKYGTRVKETYVKVEDQGVAQNDEGQPALLENSRKEQIEAEHGRLFVAEMSGGPHHFVVMSEKRGPIIQQVFNTEEEANRRLNEHIEENYGAIGRGAKVYYIPITDEMREEFSGPVAPFHYDPRQDPALKEAAEKIGYEKTPLNERLKAWRQSFASEFVQGTLDQFHGLKRALNEAEVSDNSYISARLTTSLDSMMKGVLYWGHPVWKEGIVQNEGKGLAEILQPIMNDPDTWGLYMAGKRAKTLLMEGYGNLSPEQQAIAKEQAEAFDGDVWKLIVDVVRNEKKNPVVEKIISEGRERLWTADQIDAMVKLNDKYPQFERVAKEYAAFNKKILDFGEASGIIDKDGRKTWESADYVPFYRVQDDRLSGSSLSPTSGVANQRAPIKRLKGGDANVGDILTNIMMNVTKMVDASVKNNAAMEAVDALRGSGLIAKEPMKFTQELVPMTEVRRILKEKGIDPNIVPNDAMDGLQKMMAIQPPTGEGVISIMRDGKREYYKTDDMLLWRSLTSINKKAFGRWISLFRAPKRLLTEWITIDPAFMVANFMRDTGSAFVISRDNNVPVAGALKGMGQALFNDSTMRTLVGAGAAFENGYQTGGDPEQTRKVLAAAMKSPSFARSVLDSPVKLYRAWKHIGSSVENSNRVAVYNAAIASGKSKKRAAYEAKDLMDFSMGGDWPFIQFLIQTVPFMNARAQGNYRLFRGAAENPIGFTMKGMLVGLAGLALYMAFRDDERYRELETWDKHAYFHWWIGDVHYRLPKPFEVGAIFNTVPEMAFEYHYSEENDAGQQLLRGFGHMLGETFAMNPMPQTVKPIFESAFNYNFFTGRPIVSHYEQKRLPPDQYRYRTSPTMQELARVMPSGLDAASTKIRSPLHLQNLYSNYTGTLGRYMLMGADALVRNQMDYPLPPSMEDVDIPVWGRFVRGDAPPRRTKQETEVYRLLDKTAAIQGSLSFHERQGNVEEYLETHTEHEPYIRAAKPLENIRENIQDINRAIMQIHMDRDIEPDDKVEQINELEKTRNQLFKEAYELRPGGAYNPDTAATPTREDVLDMIDKFGVDDSPAYVRSLEENSPETHELLDMVHNDMSQRDLRLLAKVGN